MRLLQNRSERIDLVLQQQDAVPDRVERRIDFNFGDPPVRAAVENDRIFSLRIDLNDRMSGRNVPLDEQGDVNPGRFKGGTQNTAVMPDPAGMHDRRTGPGQGDRLIQPLPAAADRIGFGAQRLAGTDKVIEPVDVIEIQRPEADDFFHALACSSASFFNLARSSLPLPSSGRRSSFTKSSVFGIQRFGSFSFRSSSTTAAGSKSSGV